MRQSRYYGYVRNAARTEHFDVYSYKKKTISEFINTQMINRNKKGLPVICQSMLQHIIRNASCGLKTYMNCYERNKIYCSFTTRLRRYCVEV